MPDQYKMIDQLESVCRECTLCELGHKKVDKDYQTYDPHVPGWRDGMSPLSRIMIVGPNPTIDDVAEGGLLKGAFGQQFDKILNEHGGRYRIDRNRFYLTNLVKCYTSKPTTGQIKTCNTYLRAEIEIIKPILVITFGALAFRTFCPELDPLEYLGKVVRSPSFRVKVYPTYHPASLTDPITMESFGKHFRLICEMLFRLECPW